MRRADNPTTITVPLSRKLGALTLLDPSWPAWPVGMTLLYYVHHVPTKKKKVWTCTVGPSSFRLCGTGVVQVTQEHQVVAP